MLRNSETEYGLITKLFHWLMVVVIIAMFAFGTWMVGLPISPEKFDWYHWHKSIGSLLLLAVALRFAWRLINVTPPLPASLKWHEKWAAHLGHYGLYGLMVALPVSGWLMSSAAGFPVSVFGWFTLPDLVANDKALTDLLKQVHEWLGLAIIGLASIHALAALMHHFVKKDTVLRRMLPW